MCRYSLRYLNVNYKETFEESGFTSTASGGYFGRMFGGYGLGAYFGRIVWAYGLGLWFGCML